MTSTRSRWKKGDSDEFSDAPSDECLGRRSAWLTVKFKTAARPSTSMEESWPWLNLSHQPEFFSFWSVSSRQHGNVFIKPELSGRAGFSERDCRICEKRNRMIFASISSGENLSLIPFKRDSCEFARKGTKSSHRHRKLMIRENLMAEGEGFEDTSGRGIRRY